MAFDRGSLDLAIVHVNYGEVLATQKQFSEAIQVTQEASTLSFCDTSFRRL